MERFIKISKSEQEFIAKVFGAVQMTVYRALRFDQRRGQSKQAKAIRSLALSRGGVIMNCLPECETIHDANNHMIQLFGNGVTIDVNKCNGCTKVLKKGDLKFEYTNPTFSEFEMIQRVATKL